MFLLILGLVIGFVAGFLVYRNNIKNLRESEANHQNIVNALQTEINRLKGQAESAISKVGSPNS